MIIGNGDIASVLPDREDLLFFASGVSNSQEMRQEEYKREFDLMEVKYRAYSAKRIVYFSSLSVFYSDSRYATHKRTMEMFTKRLFNKWTIIRIGNITWGNNPHTLINYFKNKIQNGEQLEIRDEFRYIIDKDEFLHWINLIPEWNCEMNITGKRMKVTEILKEYCGYTDNPYGNA